MEKMLPKTSGVRPMDEIGTPGKITPTRLVQIKVLVWGVVISVLTSTLISFIHIFHSNITITNMVKPQLMAGHLAVPNQTVADTLTGPMPALAATPFFVLTAGSFVIVAAIVSLILIYRMNIPERTAAAVYLSFWAIITLVLNYGCFSFITAAHTLLISLVVWSFVGKQAKEIAQLKRKNNRVFVFFLALAVIGSCFLVKGDRGMFLRTRDYLLLSNPYGQIVSQWYYTYSPHASQALKSTVKKPLPSKKYLENRSIETHSSRKIGLPDNMVIFRSLCLAGLIVALPLLVSCLFFLSICFLAARIMPKIIPRKFSDYLAALLTTAVAIFLLFYLTPMEIGTDKNDIEHGLNANSPRTRIETLRVIFSSRGEIFNYLTPEKIYEISQASVPERYWLAMALGISRDRRNFALLERLAKAESINVQCAALKALAQGGGNLSRKIVIDKIRNSPHWYVQETALGALKQLR